MPGFSEDDLLLELVVLMGQLALDADCVPLICSGGIVPALHEIMRGALLLLLPPPPPACSASRTPPRAGAGKQEDDELLAQCLFTFARLLRHRAGCEELLFTSGARIRPAARAPAPLTRARAAHARRRGGGGHVRVPGAPQPRGRAHR